MSGRNERRPSTPWRLPGQLGRRRHYWALLIVVIVFVFLLVHPASVTTTTTSSSKSSNDGTFKTHWTDPPTLKKLKQWERDLPQHNLDLPLPEGRNGRYVKFSNQVKRLGWNNVFNEMYVYF